MKFLAICAGGNIRSRAFAHHLMYRLGHQALSASGEKQDADTMTMLCAWADRIILLTPEYAASIPSAYRSKVKVFAVGPDLYGSPWHFEMQAIVHRCIEPWAKLGFPL
jgi:GMP synthase-like glutamine amidotransferase